MKVQIKLVGEYEKPSLVEQTGGALERSRKAAQRRKYERNEDDKNVATIGLTTKLTPITHRSDVRRTVERLLAELRERHVNSIQNGSGFVLRAIVSADISIAKHTPLDGSSYLPLPDFLARKRCIVNIQNKDNRCFGYAILAASVRLHTANHAYRAAPYDKYFEQYGLDKVNYPVKIEDLEAIERQLNIPFNVFTFFDDEGKGR